MEITPRQVEASYQIASRVFDHDMTTEAGATMLHHEHGLNINSARDFINDYRCMVQGKLFQRGMSASAIDYYLSKILEERGEACYEAAIASVEKHIEYYEAIRKIKLSAMRGVVAGHKSQKATPLSLGSQEEFFGAAVKKALADSPDKRQARLRIAARKPIKVKVVTEAYIRNADVVAEVLHRSSGVCEQCQKPAPFKRKKDSTPYLEVHHRKQLSDGGEDTVENAIALCPNCHRYLHYGLEVV